MPLAPPRIRCQNDLYAWRQKTRFSMGTPSISTVRAHCPAPSIESRLKEVEQNENSGPTVPNYDRLATHGKEFKRLRCHREDRWSTSPRVQTRRRHEPLLESQVHLRRPLETAMDVVCTWSANESGGPVNKQVGHDQEKYGLGNERGVALAIASTWCLHGPNGASPIRR